MFARGKLSRVIGEDLIVGESEQMAAVVDAIEDAADKDHAVLIEGERGTGRELVARAIHYAGPRRRADFVALKAANIPRSLIDEELGPRTLRRAQGGTLLLKDVVALARGPQRQLVRVLRRREAKKPHGHDDTPHESFDVRLIASGDPDLAPAVDADAFDRELYDRLGVRRIQIPPLRRRLADIPRLAHHFIRDIADEMGRSGMTMGSAAVDKLQAYPWPGNVGELKDVMRRLLLRLKRGPIEACDIEDVLPPMNERVPLEDLSLEELVRAKLKGFLRRVDGYEVDNLYDDVMARVERPLLELVLARTNGNQLKAAKMLGVNRNTLRKKLADLGLSGSGKGE
jgi:two-component system, NtrC family, nitrogen regulation response regulator GlnG